MFYDFFDDLPPVIDDDNKETFYALTSLESDQKEETNLVKIPNMNLLPETLKKQKNIFVYFCSLCGEIFMIVSEKMDQKKIRKEDNSFIYENEENFSNQIFFLKNFYEFKKIKINFNNLEEERTLYNCKNCYQTVFYSIPKNSNYFFLQNSLVDSKEKSELFKELSFLLQANQLIMSDYDYLLKFILIGDSGVGKSCLLYQFIEEKFQEGIEPTIGIEFGTKIIDLGNLVVRLQIWDSAGQENYRSITRSYYKNTICGILVYDITNKQTFENVKKWLEETKTYGNAEMFLTLIGNKTDLEDERQVKEKDGFVFAQENNMLFFETTAKKNNEVFKAFRNSAERIIDDIKQEKLNPYNEFLGIKVGLSNFKDKSFQYQFQTKQKKKCCQLKLKLN